MTGITITSAQVAEITTSLQSTFDIYFDTVVDLLPVLALLAVIGFALGKIKGIFKTKKIR